jgi:membrane-bound inhibitor of C-type lysozyme
VSHEINSSEISVGDMSVAGGRFQHQSEGRSAGKCSAVIEESVFARAFSFQCTAAGKPAEVVNVTYYETEPGLALIERGNRTRPAFQALSASGAKYEGKGVMFWEHQGEAQMEWSGMQLSCKAPHSK